MKKSRPIDYSSNKKKLGGSIQWSEKRIVDFFRKLVHTRKLFAQGIRIRIQTQMPFWSTSFERLNIMKSDMPETGKSTKNP